MALPHGATPFWSLQCVNELNQWLSALRKVSINNTGLLGSYHPGVFRGDKWSCCHQKDKTGGSESLGPAGCLCPQQAAWHQSWWGDPGLWAREGWHRGASTRTVGDDRMVCVCPVATSTGGY